MIPLVRGSSARSWRVAARAPSTPSASGTASTVPVHSWALDSLPNRATTARYDARFRSPTMSAGCCTPCSARWVTSSSATWSARRSTNEPPAAAGVVRPIETKGMRCSRACATIGSCSAGSTTSRPSTATVSRAAGELSATGRHEDQGVPIRQGSLGRRGGHLHEEAEPRRPASHRLRHRRHHAQNEGAATSQRPRLGAGSVPDLLGDQADVASRLGVDLAQPAQGVGHGGARDPCCPRHIGDRGAWLVAVAHRSSLLGPIPR